MESDVGSIDFQTLVDYDNDGYLDIFHRTLGNDTTINEWKFYKNNGSGCFIEDEIASVSYKVIRGHTCTSFGDFDNDGYVDMFCTFRDTCSVLYRNNGTGNNWIHVNLKGTNSNSCGIGSRVRVVSGDLVQIKDLTCSIDYNQVIQHSLTLEFGLGEYTSVDTVQVNWPSNTVDYLTNLNVNTMLTIQEGEGDPGITNVPEKFSLSQNYPNPFNLTTRINYELPQKSDVVLKVFDILGKTVATLVEQEQDAGFYSVLSNASGNTSCVYFYSFKYDEQSLTKKMLFLR